MSSMMGPSDINFPLFFEDDKSAGKVQFIADGQMMACYAFIPDERAQFGMKREIRLPKIIVAYTDMAQAYWVAHPGTHRFRKRFLGGKTLGQKHSRVDASSIFRPFLFRQQAPGKAIAIFLQQPRNARRFYQIGADSINHARASSISFFISRTARSKPTNSAWATIAWPMLSSDTSLMAATGWTL